MDWQELWCHEHMWGCRPKRGAEAMAMALSLQLEDASGPAGGISYDFMKAFDLVPHYCVLYSTFTVICIVSFAFVDLLVMGGMLQMAQHDQPQ